MKRTDIIAAVIIFALIAWALVRVATGSSSTADFGDKIAVIPLEGVIIDSKQFIKTLDNLSDRQSVKGIILQINSPGGGTTASEEMYLAVRRVSEKKNIPIFASIGSLGASGGYMVALAADVLWAAPTSLTGSIGVIIDMPQWTRLMQELGLDMNRFRSGDLKGSGSPWKELSEEEKQYFQDLVDDVYEQFLELVSERRKIGMDDLKPLARGQAFTGRQAKENGLIDELGPMQAAVDSMVALLDMGDDPGILYPAKQEVRLFDLLFGDINNFFSRLIYSPTLQMIYK